MKALSKEQTVAASDSDSCTLKRIIQQVKQLIAIISENGYLYLAKIQISITSAFFYIIHQSKFVLYPKMSYLSYLDGYFEYPQHTL